MQPEQQVLATTREMRLPVTPNLAGEYQTPVMRIINLGHFIAMADVNDAMPKLQFEVAFDAEN